jgi:hypothetical protein
MKILLIILIVLFFNSCCLFVGKGTVYKWNKDKSDYDHYLKHQNLPSELLFKLTTDKKEYYNGELKLLNLTIINQSKTDSFLINNPKFYELKLYDSTDLVRKCMWVEPAIYNQIIVEDECGRRIIKISPPDLIILPGDSIKFSNSNFLNYFGNPPCDQGLNLEPEKMSRLDLSRKAGILPCCLIEGDYYIELDYEHYMFNAEEKPIVKNINIKSKKFRILNFDEKTKNEYINFLEFCSTIHKGKGISRYKEFIENNPYNLYNKNLIKTIDSFTK